MSIKRDRIIIYGSSNIAKQIATVLYEKEYKITIVPEHIDDLEELKDLKIDIFEVSLLEDQNILDVGIGDENIKAFFCFGKDKNTNLFITLSVRNLNKNLKIISLSTSKENNKTMLLAGANKVINPYEIGALRIFRLLHKPWILDVLDNILFSQTGIEIEEIMIEKGSKLDGLFLRDLKLTKNEDVLILGIQDKELGDKFIFFSSGINHKIDHGDTIVALGTAQNLAKFKSEI
jgi:voltage-gated potassium channel